MKYISIVILILLLKCDSGSNPSREEKHLLYNDVLSQIVNDNYYQMCIEFDNRVEGMYRDLVAGKIDSTTYIKVMDSLKVIRKKTNPKCVIDYTKEFQIFTAGHALSDDIKFSMTESLKDSFLIKHFIDVSAKAIVDTLSQTAQLDAKDLAISEIGNFSLHQKIE